MPEAWRIEGEYLENCNCEVLCPCLLGPRNAKGGAAARPTEGHCDVPPGFRIARGNHSAGDRVSSRLAAARATRMTYRDHGFAWNNTGRNGHYSAFVWSGP